MPSTCYSSSTVLRYDLLNSKLTEDKLCSGSTQYELFLSKNDTPCAHEVKHANVSSWSDTVAQNSLKTQQTLRATCIAKLCSNLRISPTRSRSRICTLISSVQHCKALSNSEPESSSVILERSKSPEANCQQTKSSLWYFLHPPNSLKVSSPSSFFHPVDILGIDSWISF